MFEFKKYMEEFEKEVVISGVKQGRLSKVESVPVRNGRLEKEKFGRAIGTFIDSEICMVLDYYGLRKKTQGFINLLVEVREELSGGQVKSLNVPVVHFASIRVDTVETIAPDLVSGFPKFKKMILDMRGFCHRYGK